MRRLKTSYFQSGTEVPARVVFTHAYQHVEYHRCEVSLIQHCLTGCQQRPLQLRNQVQRSPAVHALSPATCLGVNQLVLPKLLHLCTNVTKRAAQTAKLQSLTNKHVSADNCSSTRLSKLNKTWISIALGVGRTLKVYSNELFK